MKPKPPADDPLIAMELRRKIRFTASRETAPSSVDASATESRSPFTAARDSAAVDGIWSDGRRMRPNRPPYSIT